MGSGHSNAIPVGENGVTRLVAWLNRWRVTVGLLVLGACVVEGIIEHEAPLNLLEPTPLVIGSLALIVIGAAVRITALGTINKNRVLAMTGIYSLCRHPLYVGSTLLYLGFALLMNDDEFLYLGLPYVIVFFGAAALSEEHFLKRKFGEEFERYRHMVPGFVPLGRWQPGEFSLARAMKKGGLELMVVIAVLLGAIEVMAVKFTV
jgi:protein-S-isoprenylcysteine O-methyltransferase Ste14